MRPVRLRPSRWPRNTWKCTNSWPAGQACLVHKPFAVQIGTPGALPNQVAVIRVVISISDRHSLGSRFVGDVFGKGFVLNSSDGESHTLAQDKCLAAEDVNEKERKLRAIVRLNNSVTCSVKIFDSSLHMFTFRLQACTSRQLVHIQIQHSRLEGQKQSI